MDASGTLGSDRDRTPRVGGTGEIAILIGTQSGETGEPWRVGFASLIELSGAPAGDSTAAKSLFAVARPPLQFGFDTATNFAIDDGAGVDREDRIGPGAAARRGLWIDGIVRVHLVDAKSLFPAGDSQPIVALDTAGFVADDATGAAPGGTSAVSRLRLDADTAWPEGFNGPFQDTLGECSMVRHVPIASNVYAQETDPELRAKRWDTPLLLFATIDKEMQGGRLWPADPLRIGPHFSRLDLKFSEAGDPADDIGKPGKLRTFDDLIGRRRVSRSDVLSASEPSDWELK